MNDELPSSSDPRVARILENLLRFASGDVRPASAPDKLSDDIDAIEAGVAVLGERLSATLDGLRRTRDELDERVRERTAELEAANARLVRELDRLEQTRQALRTREEQLRTAQKMKAIGQVAAGVAHDFNNMLTVILSCVIDARHALGPEHGCQTELAAIEQAARRGSALTAHLLTFTRKQPNFPVVFELNRLIRDTEKMLRRLVGDEALLRLDLAEGAVVVRLDPGQVSQMLVNLVTNSRDAMTQRGTIVIETARTKLADEVLGLDATLPPGDYVTVRVRDDGIGMSPDTVERLFEPFFTTKPAGKGTGLGLPIVYGIVHQSGGSITISSELGRGTCCEIWLPLSSEPEVASVPVRTERPAPRPYSILLVDDDEAVRAVARRGLEARGMRVVEAQDGVEAWWQLREHGDDFDLVVTDVVMPRMGGRELATKLRERRPELPVLYVSGYPGEQAPTDLGAGEGEAFLAKPFSNKQLRSAINALMTRAVGRRAGSAVVPSSTIRAVQETAPEPTERRRSKRPARKGKPRAP